MNVVTHVSAIAQTIAAAFNFEVIKKPLIALNEFGLHLPTEHFGLFRTDTQECVGKAVKKNYIPHRSVDIIAAVEAAASVFNGEVELMCDFHNGHRVHIKPTRAHRRAVYGSSDSVFPVMSIMGSFNGRGVLACQGFGRDMCLNMAEMKSVASTRISIHHNNNLPDHMEEMIEQFTQLHMTWDELCAAIDKMEANMIDIDGYLNQVYPHPGVEATDRKINAHAKTIEAIKNRLSKEYFVSERPAENVFFDDKNQIHGTASGWLLFNAVQGYVQHDGRGAGSRTEFQGIIKASNSPKVTLAEKIALGE